MPRLDRRPEDPRAFEPPRRVRDSEPLKCRRKSARSTNLFACQADDNPETSTNHHQTEHSKAHTGGVLSPHSRFVAFQSGIEELKQRDERFWAEEHHHP